MYIYLYILVITLKAIISITTIITIVTIIRAMMIKKL